MEHVQLVPAVVAEGLGYLSDFERAARVLLCGSGRKHQYPVAIVAGGAGPCWTGTDAMYFTALKGNRLGSRVYYPNAYRAAAKSARLIRLPSTRHIVVGADWRPVDW